jgi:hypothetical protein
MPFFCKYDAQFPFPAGLEAAGPRALEHNTWPVPSMTNKYQTQGSEEKRSISSRNITSSSPSPVEERLLSVKQIKSPQILPQTGSYHSKKLAKRSSRPYSFSDRASPECNLSVGKWVKDVALPVYEANRCLFLHPSANCEASGRPDLDYMYLRWQPAECDLPTFEAQAFLEAMRNKRMLMVSQYCFRLRSNSLVSLKEKEVNTSALAANKTSFEFLHWHHVSKLSN